jgi:hypothetical protein
MCVCVYIYIYIYIYMILIMKTDMYTSDHRQTWQTLWKKRCKRVMLPLLF